MNETNNKNMKILRANEVVRSRKIGGSVYVPLTGWIGPDKLYKVIKVDDKSFMLKEVKIVEEEN